MSELNRQNFKNLRNVALTIRTLIFHFVIDSYFLNKFNLLSEVLVIGWLKVETEKLNLFEYNFSFEYIMAELKLIKNINRTWLQNVLKHQLCNKNLKKRSNTKIIELYIVM